MCSSRRRSGRRAWSLRARLLIGQVVLLSTACAGIGAVTEAALYQYLIGRLDEQLHDAAHRAARIHAQPPPRWRHPPRPGPGPDFLDAPGQPAGLVGAVVRDGIAVSVGQLSTPGLREPLRPDAVEQLAEVTGRRPVTRGLDGIGRYRLVAAPSAHGADTTIVVGLPLAAVQATLLRVLIIFAAVTVAAVAAATAAGSVVIRRALAPLRRVVQTAGEVVDLPLDRGEVTLPVRVPDTDTDPRTEVGQLGLAVNRMLDHIAAALSARQASETRVRQFVADASHELRTPLTAIRGYTELAQRLRADDTDPVGQALTRVRSQTERMTHLVEDLLLLARLDSGRPLERQPVDLSRLAADAVTDAQVAGPRQQWRLELPDQPVIVVGDAGRLHQVLTNLLTNARVHTGDGTVVTTTLHTDADSAVLTVIDDGPGIPAALRSEVFERFARGDTSRSRQGGGTGLGLAIAAAVVQAHGGSIDVHSVPGRTQFTVHLPR